MHLSEFTGDFLEWEPNMKFDVVIGNPPYRALWARFIQKGNDSLMPSGHLIMIVPQGWLSPTNDISEGRIRILRDILAKQETPYVNLTSTLKEHFNGIGSTFSVIYTRNNPSLNNITVFETDEGKINVELNKLIYLPKGRTTATDIRIFTKVFTTEKTEKMEWIRKHIIKEQETYGSFTKGKYKVINGNSDKDTWYSENAPPDFDTYKIVLPYNGKDFKFVNGYKKGYGNSSVSYFSSKKEMTNALVYLNSKLVKFLLPMSMREKYTQYNEPSYLNSIPKVDFSKKWTDEELYKHFNLTQEEIDYIEANVK